MMTNITHKAPTPPPGRTFRVAFPGNGEVVVVLLRHELVGGSLNTIKEVSSTFVITNGATSPSMWQLLPMLAWVVEMGECQRKIGEAGDYLI